MQSNIRVRDSIINGEREGKTFYEIIEQGQAYDMQTFDQHIVSLFKQGIIDETTGTAYASSRAKVRQGIDSVKAGRGERTSDIQDLTIDMTYSGR
jgi:twitching motility protein PilT